ncbi:helix-turn-helix transcriptional regulator [Inquilinus sp. Marseille-Q2685]|uniref:helix-turn-helix transcriptional regulator n=1 Tax=Inquilinus sp. Marseille-Q2685 TaxID=2866581 RepID=UPI001CE4B310|nr:helix-turn-helix transcriptional regulator [Inquilinus sp. Marseille-Q2685]
MQSRDVERFSDLIGQIYDCAIDSALWPETIGAICDATRCWAGSIVVSTFEPPALRLVKSWNFDDQILACLPSFAAESAQVWQSLPDYWTRDLDRPGSSMREAPETYGESSWAQDLMIPRGIVDSMHLMLIREADRVADLALYRHQDHGPVTDQDLGLLRLLAPHIRRSVTIGDVIEMKNLERQALHATLDSVAAGIVVVGAEGRILHANDMARAMLEAGTPVISVRGRLTALNPDSNRELQQAIAVAQADESRIGAIGIGVPLVGEDLVPATAHVLPLARGQLRTRLVPQAAAAVFIAAAGTPLRLDLDTVARIYDLTPAETRQLHRLVTGDSVAEAAEALGVSQATTRTHRQHIFAKMGVSRRGELVALVTRLIPPATKADTPARKGR